MIMTTMGSTYWPQTAEGRLMCVGLALYAFAMFGYITAIVASFFVARRRANCDSRSAVRGPDAHRSKAEEESPNDVYAATRRTADDIIRRLMPLKSMFTPTRVPTAQILLAGQLPMIMNAKSSVTMPLNSSHPDPLS